MFIFSSCVSAGLWQEQLQERATLSLKLATQLPGLPTQPAVAGAGSLVTCSLKSTGKGLKLSLVDFPFGSDQLQLATNSLATLC